MDLLLTTKTGRKIFISRRRGNRKIITQLQIEENGCTATTELDATECRKIRNVLRRPLKKIIRKEVEWV